MAHKGLYLDAAQRARMADVFPPRSESRKSVAEALGISLGAVGHYFSGRRKITADALVAMKTAAPDISLDWLLTGEEVSVEGLSAEALRYVRWMDKLGAEEKALIRTISQLLGYSGDTTTATDSQDK